LNLVKKIQENIFRYELFERGGKIVIGVSGGPDSVCLLDALCKLKEKYDLQIIVAHVNYGLRGKDSDLDEKLVKDLAKRYSLNLEIKKILNTRYKIQDTGSEEKLRTIRYNFFEAVCKRRKAGAIAVGHNLNDQAETVLMRILRGTGLRGLSAIKFRNNNIIRPLLNIPRKEIVAHLRSNKIPYRIDKTNFMLDFTRNKIRNKLLPQIEKEYNPNIQETLYKFSASAAADYDFIASYAREWLAANKILQVPKLNNLHPSILSEILRQAIEKHSPSLREIESAHIEEIVKILKSNKNKRQQITFKGLKIVRIGDRLLISRSM
jgi:tRNA(Ile)-lysidine synthase